MLSTAVSALAYKFLTEIAYIDIKLVSEPFLLLNAHHPAAAAGTIDGIRIKVLGSSTRCARGRLTHGENLHQ